MMDDATLLLIRAQLAAPLIIHAAYAHPRGVRRKFYFYIFISSIIVKIKLYQQIDRCFSR